MSSITREGVSWLILHDLAGVEAEFGCYNIIFIKSVHEWSNRLPEGSLSSEPWEIK